MMGMDQDDILLAPWTTIKYRVTGKSVANVNQSAASSSESGTSQTVNTLNQIYPNAQNSLYPAQSATQAADTPLPVRFTNVDQILAAARSTPEIPAAVKSNHQILRERHRIRPGEPEDFNLRDLTELTKTLSSTATMMTKLLLAVALISLVVGGVGIMNIMLVSVTERTREIGLRMAVGARGRNILQQFLGRVGGSVLLRRSGRHSPGPWHLLSGDDSAAVADRTVSGRRTRRFRRLRDGGHCLWLLPGVEGSRLDPIIALRYE